MGGQNRDPTAHGTLWNLTLGEPVARAQLLQNQVAASQLQQAAARAGLFQDPASRAALFTDPRMAALMHLQAPSVAPGSATMAGYPQLSPGDQPLLQYMRQMPGGLPPMVMTPELAQMHATLGSLSDRAQQAAMLQQWMSGQLPGGMTPQNVRIGPFTFGAPDIGNTPMFGAQGGAAGAPPMAGEGGAPPPGGVPRQLGRIPQATRELTSAGGGGVDLNAPFFRNVEQQYQLPRGILSGLAEQESGGNPNAANPASSARGLFQFIRSTAQAEGIDPYDPVQSTIATAKMLRRNYDQTGSWERAVGAHYGGPGAPFEQRVGPSGLSPAQYANQVIRRVGRYQGGGGEEGAGGAVVPANYQPGQAAAGAVPGGYGGEGAMADRYLVGQVPAGAVPAQAQAPALGGAPQAQQVAYPSPAFQEAAPGGMMLAPPMPLPGSQVAAPQAAMGAPPPGAPPAGGGAPPGPAGGMGGPQLRGPAIGAGDVRDLQDAYANHPGLKPYMDFHGYQTPAQAMQDPWVVRQVREWKEASAIQQQARGREVEHAQTQPWEQQKTEEQRTYAEQQQEQQRTYAEQQKEEQRTYAEQQKQVEQAQRIGQSAQPYVQTRQQIRGFTPEEIQQFSGPTTGITDIWTRDPRYTDFQSKLDGMRTNMLNTARNAREQQAIDNMLPTGRESAAQFTAKLRKIDAWAEQRNEGLWTGVSKDARAPYQTDFAPLEKGARTIGPVAAEAPRQVGPQPAPAAPPPAPALPPGAATTTTPTTTGRGAQPAPVPAAARGPTAAAPQGGISAAQAAAGPRAYDVALAERLGLAQPYPGETPAETAARRAQGLPRRPAELPGAPTQFASRLLTTIAQASNPAAVGQTAKAALGATGAPGAVVGSAVEAAPRVNVPGTNIPVSGTRGAGTAADILTNLATGVAAAGGPRTVAGAGERAAMLPTAPARQLTRLAPQVEEATNQALRVVGQAAPAGTRFTPATLQVQQQVTSRLTDALVSENPAEQAKLLQQAVKLAQRSLGDKPLPPALQALSNVAETQAKFSASLARNKAVWSKIGYGTGASVLGKHVLNQLASKAQEELGVPSASDLFGGQQR